MSVSPADQWRRFLSDLHTWKRGDKRAVHKPLLTLMLIARAEAGAPREVRFAEIEEQLAKLLREFGPPRRSHHPEFPFWHLQSDGFWKLSYARSLPLKTGGHSPTRTSLRRANATGAVPDDLWQELVKHPSLRDDLTNILLTDFWPATQHAAIRSALALPDPTSDDRVTRTTRKRDARFREAVLRAYERRCAICGYDGRLSDVLLGVEAAHIKWHAYAGPDTVSNGMALCTFHHMAFDAGALGLTKDLRVMVSAEVSGHTRVEEWLLRYGGERIRRPQPGCDVPGDGVRGMAR